MGGEPITKALGGLFLASDCAATNSSRLLNTGFLLDLVYVFIVEPNLECLDMLILRMIRISCGEQHALSRLQGLSER